MVIESTKEEIKNSSSFSSEMKFCCFGFHIHKTDRSYKNGSQLPVVFEGLKGQVIEPQSLVLPFTQQPTLMENKEKGDKK